MHSPSSSSLFGLLVLAAFAASAGACSSTPPPEGESAANGATVNNSWWNAERQKRQSAIDDYLQSHKAELDSFVNVPLGHSGFPVIMMRVFGDLMPELWAPQGDPTLSVLGLGENPWKAKTLLPRGFGYSWSDPPLIPFTPVGIQVANFTCGACHVGSVRGSDGSMRYLVGAPNTQFDTNGFFKTLSATPRHGNFTGAKLKEAVGAKPDGYFYQGELPVAQERLERLLVSGAPDLLIQKTREGIDANADKRQLVANQGYSSADSPEFYGKAPGRADAFGLTVVQFVDDSTVNELPSEPAITDIMSVWNQRDRAVSHWGGEMRPSVWPVVAAEFAVAGASSIVNVDNLGKSTRLLDGLPSPPYPFDVSEDRAARGAKLFADHCSSCHKVGDDKVYPLAELGTDGARSKAFTPYTLERFNQALKDSCKDSSVCRNMPETIVKKTGGYVATPLDGIWARAPYLHNGSVPSLRHLLVPSSRPASFERGHLSYDERDVGFVFDQKDGTTTTYDTTKRGQRNTGHDTPEFLGSVDWGNEPEKLDDLIEYMKTL